ncbi:MAG: protein kinase, partial [Gemmatimonadota bacterium]|nr:protein kinase [Gemmatimonadota bacterium]
AAVIGAERFLSEIKTTANLQHPHILALFDSGNASGFLYYVMPYIEGETLRDKLDREKQLGIEESVRIARDVADALDYAHRAGVIHRDIKPGNILLHDGRPVVADFGIALAVSAAGGGRMTETGLSLGTPHYMSPEQASADRDLSARSDIYSLGCVLYEMIGGQPPHTGPSAQSILVHILTKEVTPLTELRHTVPPNVAATVSKSIEKLPADRFETAKQFRDALGDEGFTYRLRPQDATATQGVATAAVGPARPWLRDGRSVAAMLIGIGFAGLAAWGWLQPGPQANHATRSRIDLGNIELAAGFLRWDEIIVSPDGSRFATGGTVDGDRALYWRDAGDESFRVIPGTENASSVGAAFSPDGDWIVYTTRRNALLKVSLSGGAPATVVPPGDNFYVMPSWGDNGMIVVTGPNGMYQVAETGGEPELLREGSDSFFSPSLLPGGWAVVGNLDGGGIMLLDLATDSIRELVPSGFDPKYVETGHLLYVDESGRLWAVAFDAERGEVLGVAVPVLDGVNVNLIARYSVSRNGTLVYGTGRVGAAGESQLVVVDLEGNEDALVLAPRQIGSVGWSPDGEEVIYSSSPRGGPRDIFTYNTVLNIATPMQLTSEGDNINPVFSPDGTHVAFASARDSTDLHDLFVKNLGDNSPPRSMVRLEGDLLVTQWPSDSLIVFERRANANSGLWTVDLSDPDNPVAEEYLGSEANLRYMVVSPDGTLAAYRSNESGQNEIYIRSFPLAVAPTKVSQDGGEIPFWSPDGDKIYYTAGGALMVAHLERDPVPVVLSTEELFTLPPGAQVFQGSGLDPTGERFIVARTPSDSEPENAASDPERFLVVTNWFTELRERMGEN